MSNENGAAHVLLVNDDPNDTAVLEALACEHGLRTVCVNMRDGAALSISALPAASLCIICAQDAPGSIARLRSADPAMKIVAVGPGEDLDQALDCMRAGANDYLRGAIGSRALLERLQAHFAGCSRPVGADTRRSAGAARFGIVGESVATEQARAFVARMSVGDVTTLIGGPTGSGKEVIALALHRNSPRAGKPLVAINCAALPEELIVGELFGYERGAFSGAVTAYPGKLTLADGGTLFLDEIGELSLSGQAKLLRAIEARQCYRLGGRKAHSFDIRIIAATNRDLQHEVARGTFRADLYFRIAVAQISLTGLASRKADVVPLARHFLALLRKDRAARVPGLGADAIRLLEAHDWPGNARELRNAMEVALLSAAGRGTILADDLPASIAAGARRAPRPLEENDDPGPRGLTPSVIGRALRRCHGNRSAAARLLGCSRMTIYRHLQADPGLALER